MNSDSSEAVEAPAAREALLKRCRRFFAAWWLWLVLGVAWTIELAMVWGVDWLPMQDIGGHLEMMDIMARYGDSGTIYDEIYTVGSPLTANGLGLILNVVLEPLIGTLATSKLMLSAYVVGLPWTLHAVAAAFDRPKWTALFGVALTFTAFFNIGFLNFLIALPFMLASVAVARRFAAEGGVGRGFGLATLLLLTYLSHVLVFLMVLPMVGLLLLLFVPRWRHSARALPLVGALVLLVVFIAKHSGSHERAIFQGKLGSVYEPLTQRLGEMHTWGLNFWRNDTADEWVWLIGVLVWLVALVASVDRIREPPRGDPEPIGSVRAIIGRHFVELVALGALLAYFVLPSHVREVHIISQRTWPVALLFFALWPRKGIPLKALVPIVAPLAVLAIAYPAVVLAKAVRFESQLIGDLPTAVADLPDGTALVFLRTQRDEAITHMGTLWHIPKAIHAVYNGGYTNDSFASQAYHPVSYRAWAAPPREFKVPEAWSDPRLGHFDHVLLNSPVHPKPALKSPRLKERWHQGAWWLFDVVKRPGDDLRMYGGTGGYLQSRHLCRGRRHLTGLDSAFLDTGTLVVRVVCGGRGGVRKGKVLGSSGKKVRLVQLRCPKGRAVKGVSGHADHYLRQLTLHCDGPSKAELSIGRPHGQAFEATCPEGERLAGLQIRYGSVVDAVALICRDEAAPPEPELPVPKKKTGRVAPKKKTGRVAPKKKTGRVAPKRTPRRVAPKLGPKKTNRVVPKRTPREIRRVPPKPPPRLAPKSLLGRPRKGIPATRKVFPERR